MSSGTASHADAHWPDETVQRGDVRRLGLWMFLATVTMLFAAFTSAYIVRRSGSDWQRAALPSILWWNTGILAASSIALEMAIRFGSRRRWRASSLAFVGALTLGVGFVGGQVVAWRQLVAAGVYLPSNPFNSFFYMMTGAHAAHVVAALIVLGWGAASTAGGAGRRAPVRWDASMSICRTFWHYLGAVWIFLFLLVSVDRPMTQTAASAIDRWSGGTCPFEAGWRKVLMWAFIVTDGLLFAGFLAAYGYARILAFKWPDQSRVFSVPYIAAMTFVLISSSATMASAVEAAREGRKQATLRLVLFTIIGGGLFLGMQAFEWRHVIEEGMRLNANPWGDVAFGVYFFLLTGFHGTHVLTGLITLVVVAVRSARGIATPVGVEMAGLYWHFVDLVWVFIFTLFYLL